MKIFGNKKLMELIAGLKEMSNKEDVAIWKRIASDLEKPSRSRRLVNIHRIQRNTKENDIIVVPGKVLSDGDIDHKVTVAAFKLSDKAAKKITSVGGKVLSIEELMNENKKGSKVKIIG